MSAINHYNPKDMFVEHGSLGYIVLRQMDRVNYLLTYRFAGAETSNEKTRIFFAAKAGLRSIEAMVSHALPKEYYKGSKGKIGRNDLVFNFQNEDAAIESLGKWFDLLVEHLGVVGLLPRRSVSMADDEDWGDVIDDDDD